MCSNYPGIKFEPALETLEDKICHHMLTSSTQLQNSSFHVLERTRTSSKCQKMKNARAKRAKIMFFIVKYANLWVFSCRRRRGCLSSLITPQKRNKINNILTHLKLHGKRKKVRVTPRGSPKQQKAMKLMATPIFCRPEPRTTPLQTPSQKNNYLTATIKFKN